MPVSQCTCVQFSAYGIGNPKWCPRNVLPMLKHMCLLASNRLCPPSKSVLKVAAIFWPQNWSQKYEGRLSAFILLGPLSWPEYGRYFLALFENRLGPRKWPITLRFPKAQKTIEPILEADDPPFSRNAQRKTSHLRHAPLQSSHEHRKPTGQAGRQPPTSKPN